MQIQGALSAQLIGALCDSVSDNTIYIASNTSLDTSCSSFYSPRLNKQQENQALFENNYTLPSQYVRYIYTNVQKAHYSISGELKQTPYIKKLRTSLHNATVKRRPPYKAQSRFTVVAFIQESWNYDTRRA
jgi:hypothetical protein